MATEASSSPDVLKDEAFTAIRSYREKGVGKNVINRYDDTAEKYDQYMAIANYKGPSQLAKTMTELYPRNREVIKILDVASGTGLAGLAMWEAGFRQIDGVDPSQGMLAVARDKNVYSRLICNFVDGDHELDVEMNTYDAITIVGGMGENQLSSGSFGEFIRITKPGGVVVNVTRAEHYSDHTQVDEYRTKLNPYFRKLEDAGKWKEESRTHFPTFILNNEGMVMVHRVL